MLCPPQGVLRDVLPNCTSCAVVGSSGSLLGGGQGAGIDAAACVIRLGAAPTTGALHPDVGGKTTARFVDTLASQPKVQHWSEPQDGVLLLAARSVHHVHSVGAAWAAAATRAAGSNASASGALQAGPATGAEAGPGRSDSGGQGPHQLLINPAAWCWLHEWTKGRAAQPSIAFAGKLQGMLRHWPCLKEHMHMHLYSTPCRKQSHSLTRAACPLGLNPQR